MYYNESLLLLLFGVVEASLSPGQSLFYSLWPESGSVLKVPIGLLVVIIQYSYSLSLDIYYSFLVLYSGIIPVKLGVPDGVLWIEIRSVFAKQVPNQLEYESSFSNLLILKENGLYNNVRKSFLIWIMYNKNTIIPCMTFFRSTNILKSIN